MYLMTYGRIRWQSDDINGDDRDNNDDDVKVPDPSVRSCTRPLRRIRTAPGDFRSSQIFQFNFNWKFFLPDKSTHQAQARQEQLQPTEKTCKAYFNAGAPRRVNVRVTYQPRDGQSVGARDAEVFQTIFSQFAPSGNGAFILNQHLNIKSYSQRATWMQSFGPKPKVLSSAGELLAKEAKSKPERQWQWQWQWQW